MEGMVATKFPVLLEFASLNETRQARDTRPWARRDLRICSCGSWQKIWRRVYCVSESQNLKKDFGLCDQFRRSAVSVASNLAERDERSSDRDSVRLFYMAKGSVAEVRTQIQIACEVGHRRKPEYDILEAEYEQLAKKIGSSSGPGAKPLAIN